MSRYVVTMTGASGSAYGLRLAEQLLLAHHEVVFMATAAGRDVCAYELGFDLPRDEGAARAVLAFLELPHDAPLRVADTGDLFDAVASGTHPITGMVVIPASMGFCGSIAAGLASDLAERAADVMLKERRPLVIVPRETPLSPIHLRNLTTLAEAGALVVPAMPAFYHRPETVDDLVNFVVGKVLDVLGVEHGLLNRWGG
jgi:4-hydroxy-3-polyprenylbenzoate decarboxylase